MFHYQDTVEMNRQGVTVDVSTVELPGHGYETCLFFPNGDSDVVASYGSVERARHGHTVWLDATRIAKAWDDYLAVWY